MAQPNDETTSVPICVIGSQFMEPNPLEVIVDTNSRGNIVVTDINHKIIFKVKPCNTYLHQQRLLLHADDRPIAMLQDKLMTEHKRWKVYKGDSTAKSDMIFSTKTAKVIQSKTNMRVFLENKETKKDACDFMIKGSWSKRNCTIYMGDSSLIIARIHTMQSLENARFVNDTFMLEVFANVDYAFVVALIAIVDATKSSNRIVEVLTDGDMEMEVAESQSKLAYANDTLNIKMEAADSPTNLNSKDAKRKEYKERSTGIILLSSLTIMTSQGRNLELLSYGVI
ncbi:tubby C-terminal-like domain-containing protein [Artemisia annua]|uniref:Tubby C-terminal-like domain-containing protein n=1 Tax=Artemisia annua TaxID=35608 RepID=A0A2U1ME72_ARTAN|nr:tubby C-terminal-like domain-containing protein [Artemisia annua]